jgi:hypothetical protein
MLHPECNLKLFEPVATRSGTEPLRLTGITVANRPFHSEPRFESPTDARFVSHLAREDGRGVTFAVDIHKPVKLRRGLCMETTKCSLPGVNVGGTEIGRQTLPSSS